MPREADPALDVEPRRLQPAGDRPLHRGFLRRVVLLGGGRQRPRAVLGVVQVTLEEQRSAAGHAALPDVGAAHRAEDNESPSRPGHEDVEPPLASGTVQGSEIQTDLARRVGAVAHGDEDDVALVSLDVLEVLDEEMLRTVGVEVLLEALVAAPELLEPVEDRHLLRLAEGPDAEGELRTASVVVEHRLGDGLGFHGIATAPRAIEDAVDGDELYPEVLPGDRAAGERLQAAVVEVLVRESDEGLVTASIVPA